MDSLIKKEQQRQKIKSHVIRHERRVKTKAKIRSHVLRHEAHILEKSGQGFTFIEILVAVTIIAIFSAITVGSLNVSRQKGKDANIKQELHNLRTQTSLFQIDAGNFGTADNTGAGATCDASGSVFLNPVDRKSVV